MSRSYVGGKGDEPRQVNRDQYERGHINAFAKPEEGYVMLKHTKCGGKAFQYKESEYVAGAVIKSEHALTVEGREVCFAAPAECWYCGENINFEKVGEQLDPPPRDSDE